MYELANKNVLVIGLGSSGRSACRLLRDRGARVTAVDVQDDAELRQEAEQLLALGAIVELGCKAAPGQAFDLAVVSPGVPLQSEMVKAVSGRGIPVIGELELGYQQSLCLNIAITGTNGKTTTTELVERILSHCHRPTLAAGNIGVPLTSVVDRTRELDLLTLEVSSFQLESTRFFRPIIAVLLNLTPDHLDRYPGMADYVRAKARLFMNQQVFDWAIVQSEALAQMHSLGIRIPAKTITFSAVNRRADLFYDRGLLVSRLPEWSGPLFDMAHSRLQGPHNAENLMAALAVGRILRLPLEQMVEALKSYPPAAHRCELIAEINGVRFVNDSKATNPDAVSKALQAMPLPAGGEPNVHLIAGGKDKGFDYHDLGPLISQRVKRAYLIGETREKLRSAWSLFTPCTLMDSLLEAVSEAAGKAEAGDVVLLSPACSSFDQFRNYQQRGETFRRAVKAWAQAASGSTRGQPSRQTSSA